MILRAALRFAALGYPVFRCKPNAKRPDTLHGKDDATTEPPRVRAMFRAPGNLGLLPPPGVVVLDFDPPSEAERPNATTDQRLAEAWARLEYVYNFASAARSSPLFTSRSGAPHVFTRMPAGTPAPTCGPFYGPDGERWGDVRGDGQTYVLVHPSQVDGQAYGVVRRLVPPDLLPEVTTDLLGMLTTRPAPSSGGRIGSVAPIALGDAREVGDPESFARALLQGAHDRLAPLRSGRHDATRDEARVLGRWVAGYERANLPGLSEHDARDALEAANRTNEYLAKVGLSEVHRTINAGLTFGFARPFNVTTPATPRAISTPTQPTATRAGVVLMSAYQELLAKIRSDYTADNVDEALAHIMPRLVREDFTDAERDALLQALAKATGVHKTALRKTLQETRRAEPNGEGGGYQLINGALHYMKPTAEGQVPAPLANFAATITREEVRDDGLEQVRHFVIAGQLADGRPLPTAEVPAARFAGMTWVTEHWGTQAIVHAGFGTKDHLRVAIQARSGNAPLHTVYEHFGWRQLPDGWAYLHAGGAITADGNTEDVEVQPPDPGLRRYELPDPPSGDELRASVRASLGLHELGPYRITFPLLAAAYRAPLAELVPTDFSIALTGPTGSYKTETVAAFQAHYGQAFDGRNLPAAWTDTENAIERKAFIAKDALFPVDDFNPSGSTTDQARAHRTFERVGRAQGNQAGRARLRSDTSFRPSYHPRGLIVSTGEEAPRGHSLRARILNIDVSGATPQGEAGDVAPEALTRAQQEAHSGRLAQAMSGYLQWLAPQLDTLREELRTVRADLRTTTRTTGHARTPEQVTDLALGLTLLLRYAHHVGAINAEELHRVWRDGWEALEAAAARQAAHQAQEDPARRFIELLASGLATGGAHVADTNGEAPINAGQWGWQRRDSATGAEWQHRGDQIGWLDGDQVLLEPDAAYAAAQRLAQRQGTNIPVTQRTLFKRVAERGLLAGADPGRTTAKREVAGARHRVLVLQSSSLLHTEPGQSGHDGENDDTDATERAPNSEMTGAAPGHAPPFPGHKPAARPDPELARPDPQPEAGRKDAHETTSHTEPAPNAPKAPQSQRDPAAASANGQTRLQAAAARELDMLKVESDDDLRTWAAERLDKLKTHTWWRHMLHTQYREVVVALRLMQQHNADPNHALNAARDAVKGERAMSPTKDDALAELATRHYLGQYTPHVAKRLDELFSMPHRNLEQATTELLKACEHLGVTGEAVEEVVARLPGGDA